MALFTWSLESIGMDPKGEGLWNSAFLNQMFLSANEAGGGLSSLVKPGTYKVDSASLAITAGIIILAGPNVAMVDSVTLVPIPTLEAITVYLSQIVGPAFLGLTNATLAIVPGFIQAQQAFTIGSSAAGDGGGGGYYWDATNVTAADGALILGAFTLGRWVKFI